MSLIPVVEQSSLRDKQDETEWLAYSDHNDCMSSKEEEEVMICNCSECEKPVVVTEKTLVVPFMDGQGFHARVRTADLRNQVVCTACAQNRVAAGQKNYRYAEAERLQKRFREERVARLQEQTFGGFTSTSAPLRQRPVRVRVFRQPDTMSFGGAGRPTKIAGEIPPAAHRRGEKQKRKKTPPAHVARYLAQATA